MKETDKKEFLSVMYALGSIYEIPFDNKLVLKVWFDALSDYDIEEVTSAVQRYIKSPDLGTFKPKPADLIKMIEGTSADKALLAWTKVEKGIRRVGTYATVVFDDPIIHRVVSDMGGWATLCQSKEVELPFISKEFATRYRGFSQRQEIPEHPRKLYGIIDMQNGSAGYNEEMQPVLIGDQEKASNILSGALLPGGEIKRLLS